MSTVISVLTFVVSLATHRWIVLTLIVVIIHHTHYVIHVTVIHIIVIYINVIHITVIHITVDVSQFVKQMVFP
jgi:hypothetical protein